MKLLDLDPRWLTPNVLMFLCPCCRKSWLTCKNIVLTEQALHDLFEARLGPDWNETVIPCRPDFAWTFWNTVADKFSVLSVTPSINASASGHAHADIVNGEVI